MCAVGRKGRALPQSAAAEPQRRANPFANLDRSEFTSPCTGRYIASPNGGALRFRASSAGA